MITGSRIVGKWHQQTYEVKRVLGEGANGKVYLVRHGSTYYAMKVGFDSIDLQSEVNVLKTLDKRLNRREPYLRDVDDFIWRRKTYPFYVMKYVPGLSLDKFMEHKGADWLFVVGKNLLTQLAELHQAGWQFGDLKVENVIVGTYGQTKLIDYGGVTPIGHSVKQFTEVYDRGYWRSGSRIADEKYDLFSFAVICIQLIVSRRKWQEATQVPAQNRNVQVLLSLLAEEQTMKPFHPFIIEALEGRFANANDALKAWRQMDWRGKSKTNRRSGTSQLKRVLFVSIACFFITALLVFQLQ